MLNGSNGDWSLTTNGWVWLSKMWFNIPGLAASSKSSTSNCEPLKYSKVF